MYRYTDYDHLACLPVTCYVHGVIDYVIFALAHVGLGYLETTKGCGTPRKGSSENTGLHGYLC